MPDTPPAALVGRRSAEQLNADEIEVERTSRASSRHSRNTSRSNSRASIRSDFHSQSEINDAVKKIENTESGRMFLALIKQMNKWDKKNKIDLTAIARFAQEIDHEELPTAPVLLDPESGEEEEYEALERNRTRTTGRYGNKNREELEFLREDEIMRQRLLDIELNDRTFQRRMIDPPGYFKRGKSSLAGREEEIKMHFSAAFGGARKFSGRKVRGDDSCILQLLEEFNEAQSNTPVTEKEFLSFLAKAMTGPAHRTMMRYIQKHKSGNMSVGDIYLALTDVFFNGYRPATALEKMKSLNEYNHSYNSLSDAHNDLEHLAHMVGLSARDKEAKDALTSNWYHHTLMNIIPKEFLAVAISSVEKCGNLKGRDLSPFELLRSLTKIRTPIDEHFRRMQAKNNASQKVKAVYEDRRPEDDSLPYPPPTCHRIAEVDALHEPERKATKPIGKRGNNWNTGSKEGEKKDCKLCGSSKHWAAKCPLFPEGMNNVANTECKQCNANLYHFPKHCPFTALRNSKN